MTTDTWTEWSGGECPVPGKQVFVRMRDGNETSAAMLADGLEWEWARNDPSIAMRRHREKFDIVSYRLA